MITHTSITEYLNMPINQFFNICWALSKVLEKRNNK